MFTKGWVAARVPKERFPAQAVVHQHRHYGVNVSACLEFSVAWHCIVLSPRDYSDLKRLRCLLNVQSSKQQVVFPKNVKVRMQILKGVGITSLSVLRLLLIIKLFFFFLPLFGGLSDTSLRLYWGIASTVCHSPPMTAVFHLLWLGYTLEIFSLSLFLQHLYVFTPGWLDIKNWHRIITSSSRI